VSEANAARAIRRADAPAVPAERLERLVTAVETVFLGKREVVRLALTALLARGHVLFEDIPGVGKTTLARSLAAALGLEFRRIQFTSDLLPSDILGVSVYDPRSASFETRPGPVFTNIVIADEINRSPPRTQSGLLEAMQEGHVTIDDATYALPRPFVVMATQNPLEHHGTYPLPESQLDRFLMRLVIGYPDEESERRILVGAAGGEGAHARIDAVMDAEGVLALQDSVDRVGAAEPVVEYVMRLVSATRTHPRLRVGASPRASIGLFRAARAYALLDGRDFVVPDDIHALVVPCLAHRILPQGQDPGSAEAAEESELLLREILAGTEVPL
jgi:MoxR-like ATPase